MSNPVSIGAEAIERGKRIFEGKAFCRTCHGIDGKGLGSEAAQPDGKLLWILKNGNRGTTRASGGVFKRLGLHGASRLRTNSCHSESAAYQQS